MKKQSLLVVFLFIVISAFAQKNDNEAILKVLEDQRQGWNRGDIHEYMQGYLQSDSLLFVGKSGPQYGWKNTLDNYKKSYPEKATMGFLTFDVKEIRLIGRDHAFVIGAWHLKREKDDPKGFFTLLFKKIKGEWKVIADHSS